MKISKREMWLILSAYFVICIYLMFFYIKDRNITHENNEAEISSLNSKINIYNRYIKMNKLWEKELLVLEKNIEQFDVNEKSVSPRLMQTIKNIADKNGVNITRNQPFEEKPIGDLFEIGINCTWNSDLKSLIKFLAELQKENLKYDVKTINISPDSKYSGKLKGNMIIECAYTKK